MCAVIRRLRYATLSRTFVRAAPDVATCRNACCSSLWPSFQSAVVKKFATRFRCLKTRRRGLIRAVALSLAKLPNHQSPPDCWSVRPRTETARRGNLDGKPGLNTDASKVGSGRNKGDESLSRFRGQSNRLLSPLIYLHRDSVESAGRGGVRNTDIFAGGLFAAFEKPPGFARRRWSPGVRDTSIFAGGLFSASEKSSGFC